MNDFFTILTTVGLAKIANATITNTSIGITKMVVGDGNGNYYTPTIDQTGLRNEVWRGTVNSVETEVSNPNWIKVEGLIPSTVGGFTVREVGVIDNAGDLIAIGKYPATYKPTLDEGSSKDLILRMILEVSNASAVTLKVDPSVVMASKKYVDDILINKANKKDLQNLQQTVTEHQAEDATNAKKGHVQLVDDIIGNSNSLVPTQNAVRKKFEQTIYKKTKSGKDSNGVFTTIEYRRKNDNTLACRAVLTGGISPQYTTRTLTLYGIDGTTVENTITQPLSYDADGDLVGES